MSNLVIGGTGSLGEAFIRKLISQGESATCFSRCELKQKELAARINSPLLRCIVGDIRDYRAIKKAVKNHYAVFHFAALKHVDTLEMFPEEAVKTNVEGTVNVLDAIEGSEVRRYVFSSIDKAVDPVNGYGFSKALAEKIISARAKDSKNISFASYRWGNVISSRGSVIPQFVKAILSGSKVKVTDPAMTRFWIKITEAVNFIANTYLTSSNQINIPPIKAASVVNVIAAIGAILGKDEIEIEVVGIRPGEKIHERLLSEHEDPTFVSSNEGLWFTEQELIEYLKPNVLELVK